MEKRTSASRTRMVALVDSTWYGQKYDHFLFMGNSLGESSLRAMASRKNIKKGYCSRFFVSWSNRDLPRPWQKTARLRTDCGRPYQIKVVNIVGISVCTSVSQGIKWWQSFTLLSTPRMDRWFEVSTSSLRWASDESSWSNPCDASTRAWNVTCFIKSAPNKKKFIWRYSGFCFAHKKDGFKETASQSNKFWLLNGGACGSIAYFLRYSHFTHHVAYHIHPFSSRNCFELLCCWECLWE